MRYDALADVPAPAHAKAIGALDGFDEILVAYVALLDTQRAHVAAGSFDALAESLAQGDVVAARVAACGRRAAPLRDAVAAGQFSGPRARDLARRFAVANVRAQRARDLADSLAAVCLAARETAEDEMKHLTTRVPGAPKAYARLDSRPLALDRQG